MLVGLLIIIPLIAGLLVFFTKGNTSRTLALSLSVIEFILSFIKVYNILNNFD